MHLIRRRPAYLRLVRESPAPPPPAVAPVSAGIKGGLAGLFHGALLPMVSRQRALIAAFAAPILGSALLHTLVGIVNPLLDRRIDWFWFVVAQIAFGIVAGIVISRQLTGVPSSPSGARDRRSKATSRIPVTPGDQFGSRLTNRCRRCGRQALTVSSAQVVGAIAAMQSWRHTRLAMASWRSNPDE